MFMNDKGPQYNSQEMRKFAKLYGFRLDSSSPHHPSSNGLAEWCRRSPAELLFGRKIHDNLPQRGDNFIPDGRCSHRSECTLARELPHLLGSTNHWSFLPSFKKAERS